MVPVSVGLPSWNLARGLNNLKTDGMYGNFAGRDASRGMAKQSFDLGALVVY